MSAFTPLAPTQPKTERPRDFIGGTFEQVGDGVGNFLETLIGTGQGFTHENTPDPDHRPGSSPVPEIFTKAFAKGEIGDFRSAKGPEKSDAQLILEQRGALAEAKLTAEQEVRYEVAGMSEEERNRRLKLNPNLKREHTEDIHHMAELYRQAKADLRSDEYGSEVPMLVLGPAKKDMSMNLEEQEGQSRVSAGGSASGNAGG